MKYENQSSKDGLKSGPSPQSGPQVYLCHYPQESDLNKDYQAQKSQTLSK